MPITENPTAADSPRAGRPAAPVFPRILCAVDGTRSANGAVRAAARLAGDGGRLTLLAVTGESGSGQYAAAAISPTRAQVVLDLAERLAEREGIEPDALVVDRGAPPTEAILARARDADLLVLGPPKSRLARMFVRSVAADALARFTTPLLIARGPSGGPLEGRAIVVADDGRPESQPVADLAGRIAAAHGARAVLVGAAGSETDARSRIEQRARRLADTVPGGCTTQVEAGPAADVVLAAAGEHDAALILAGSRRRRGLHAFGSVSRRLVREAQCPVLLVPPQDARSESS